MLKDWLYYLFRFYQFSRYVRLLPYQVAQAYGIRESYKASQLDKIIKEKGFNHRYRALAYAMFCSEAVFEKVDFGYRKVVGYHRLRNMVAKRYLDGNREFNICHLLLIARQQSGGTSYINEAGPRTVSSDWAKLICDCEDKGLVEKLDFEDTYNLKGLLYFLFIGALAGFMLSAYIFGGEHSSEEIYNISSWRFYASLSMSLACGIVTAYIYRKTKKHK